MPTASLTATEATVPSDPRRPRHPAGWHAAAALAPVLLVGCGLLGLDRKAAHQTLVDLRKIGAAVESYAIDNGHYPEASTVTGLEAVLVPVYAKELPLSDGWGHGFAYETWQDRPNSRGPDRYAVASPGRDGEWETAKPSQAAAGVTSDPDADIVFMDASYHRHPPLPTE